MVKYERTAKCLPHCKLVVYSNCGHNVDTDMPDELAEEADRFLQREIRKRDRSQKGGVTNDEKH